MTVGDRERGDREAIERAMAGVRPLARGKERVTPTPARPAVRRSSEAHDVEFVREGEEGQAGFYARDLGRDPLLRLRRGEVDVTLAIDLHGMTADAAKHAIVRLFERAVAARAQGLHIIHGKGRRSQSGPVLPGLVREMLQRPPLARQVAAFAPATRREGDAGATNVCLRRPRRSTRL